MININWIFMQKVARGTLIYKAWWCSCWLVLAELKTSMMLIVNNFLKRSKGTNRTHSRKKRPKKFIGIYQTHVVLSLFYLMSWKGWTVATKLCGVLWMNKKPVNADWLMFWKKYLPKKNMSCYNHKEPTPLDTLKFNSWILVQCQRPIGTCLVVTFTVTQDLATTSLLLGNTKPLSRCTTTTLKMKSAITSQSMLLLLMKKSSKTFKRQTVTDTNSLWLLERR